MNSRGIVELIERVQEFASTNPLYKIYVDKLFGVYYDETNSRYIIRVNDSKYIYDYNTDNDYKVANNLSNAIISQIKSEISMMEIEGLTTNDISFKNKLAEYIEAKSKLWQQNYYTSKYTPDLEYVGKKAMIIRADDFDINEMLIVKLVNGDKKFVPITLAELKDLLNNV